MSITLSAALALATGFLLGVSFYGGLKWTVGRGVVSTIPALWFSASFFLRTALSVGAFYVVSRGAWPLLLACLLGFGLGRIAVLRGVSP